MLIQDFSGGLDERVSPNLIAKNAGTVYSNIDNASGALKPLLGITDTTDNVNNFYTRYYGFNSGAGKWVFNDVTTHYVEYKEKIYLSCAVTSTLNPGWNEYPQKYDGATYSALGKTEPTAAPTVVPTFKSADTVTDAIVSSIAQVNDAGTVSLSQAKYYKLIAKSTKDYKSYEFSVMLRSDYSATGQGTVTVGVTLPSTYFNSGDNVVIYRRINGVYKRVTSGNWTVGELSLTDTVGAIGEREDYPTVEPAGISKFYSYCYTYYDSTTGEESKPSPISEEVDVGLAGYATLSAMQTSEAKRIYRIGGDLIDFTLVTELASGVTSYTDNVLSDLDIAGNHILDSQDYGAAPRYLKYLTESYAMLFGAVEDKLYYSAIGKPWAWSVFHFIDFEEEITGIGPASNGMLVFTKYKTYIVTGNSHETFSKYLLSGSQGCLKHDTIKFVDNNVLWLSTDGICATTGGTINVISLPKLGKLDFNSSTYTIYNAAVYDNVYYLSYMELTTKKILAYDFRYNQIVKQLTTGGSFLGVFNDILYQTVDTVNLNTLFTGTALTLDYTSPLLDDNNMLEKLYDNVLIAFGPSGTGTLKTYIDGILVTTTTLTGALPVNYIEVIAANYQVGNNIQFAINGTKEINELSYIAYDRNNIVQSKTFFNTTSFKETVLVNSQIEIFNLTTTSLKYSSDVIPVVVTNNKMFSNIYFTFIGTVTVYVKLDGAIVNTYEITSATLTTIEKKISSASSRAYYMSFDYLAANINSKLYAIETKVLGRQS